MRCTMGILLVCACCVGCDGERIVTPQDAATRLRNDLGRNDVLPPGANRPAPIRGRPALPAGEAPATAPVVVTTPGMADATVNGRPIDPYTADYNPGSVMTIRGPVVGFKRIALSHDRTGLFARVSVGGEFPDVYLGPESWLVEHNFLPEITSMISATGSMVSTASGPQLLIAREATMGDVHVAIREENGTPLYPVPADIDGDGVQ
jgi:hypothetical protein